MPEMTLGVIIFCSLFALAFSGVVVWILERKVETSRREVTPLAYSFLAGSVTFTFVYISNRLFFPHWPKITAVFNLAALAGIFIFPVLRKKLRHHYRHRRPKIGKKHRRRAEAAALEHMLEQDPLNAFCLEKLSEIYDEMGKKERALEAAQEAFRLDPTMRNKWRVEDLKKEIHEKKRHRNGWNFWKIR